MLMMIRLLRRSLVLQIYWLGDFQLISFESIRNWIISQISSRTSLIGVQVFVWGITWHMHWIYTLKMGIIFDYGMSLATTCKSVHFDMQDINGIRRHVPDMCFDFTRSHGWCLGCSCMALSHRVCNLWVRFSKEATTCWEALCITITALYKCPD